MQKKSDQWYLDAWISEDKFMETLKEFLSASQYIGIQEWQMQLHKTM